MQGPDRAIRIVTSNKMLAVVDMSLGPDSGIAASEVVRRTSEIAQDGPFAARVGHQALAHRYPPWPATEVVEARIFEGFPSRADEGRMQAFHAASWPGRAEIFEAFEDDRLLVLGRRIVFLEQSEVLRPELRQGLETWLHNRPHGCEDVQAGRTIGDAMAEIDNSEHTGETFAAIRAWLGCKHQA